MKIEHLAIQTNHLEKMTSFYELYFGAQAGTVYVNEAKQFKSRFLTFSSGCRLELIQQMNVQRKHPSQEHQTGYAHLAFSVGSKEAVNSLTERLVRDGFEKLDGPRATGDGYYESALLDPEGNSIEITE